MSSGVMSNLDRLVYMANQIARNFEVEGEAAAVNATHQLILRNWPPRMKAQIFARMDQPECELGTIARQALERLRATET